MSITAVFFVISFFFFAFLVFMFRFFRQLICSGDIGSINCTVYYWLLVVLAFRDVFVWLMLIQLPVSGCRLLVSAGRGAGAGRSSVCGGRGCCPWSVCSIGCGGLGWPPIFHGTTTTPSGAHAKSAARSLDAPGSHGPRSGRGAGSKKAKKTRGFKLR